MNKVYNRLRTIAYAKKYCKDDVTLIENYDKMMADNIHIWHCHHRREIDENKLASQLIEENLYYNRPACELIFLTNSDHRSLHNKYRTLSEGTIKKMSDVKKGNRYGAGNAGKHHSDTIKLQISESMKCLKWWNNGVINVRTKECPGEGFIRGRLMKGNAI